MYTTLKFYRQNNRLIVWQAIRMDVQEAIDGIVAMKSVFLEECQSYIYYEAI